jgi:TIR domain
VLFYLRWPRGGVVARVFVSHASEELECAGQLHQWLVADGHEVFLDRDLRDGIPVGEEWEQRLHERLRSAVGHQRPLPTPPPEHPHRPHQRHLLGGVQP